MSAPEPTRPASRADQDPSAEGRTDAAEGPRDAARVGGEGTDALGQPPEAYVIPRVLAQATLDYLASQPYREVFGLVRGFESLQPLPDPPPGRGDAA
jgi:hypothetical protein